MKAKTAFALVAIAAASLAALALPALAAAQQIIIPKAWCTDAGDQTQPSLSHWWKTETDPSDKPNVIWTTAGTGFDIWGVNFWKDPWLKGPVTTAVADQSQGDVMAGVYAWIDARNGNDDVYGTDLWWGAGEFPICTAASRQEHVAVEYHSLPENDPKGYELLAVWQDDRSGNWDIYGAYIDKDTYAVKEFPICVAPGDQTDPDTDGYVVVWEDTRNGDHDIYGYKLDAKEEFPICVTPAEQRDPMAGGMRVVWQDDRRGNWDIWVYDVDDFGWRPTGKPLPMVVEPGNQTNPSTGSDNYYYEDDRNAATGNGIDIYALISDFFAGPDAVFREIAVFTGPGDQTGLTCDGTYLAWQDSQAGSVDILGCYVTEWNAEVKINDGGAWTRSGDVQVAAWGKWLGQPASHVSLSNDEDLWSLWLPQEGSPRAWTLAAGVDGLRTVSAQFYDGDISPTIRGTITLDTHGPTTVASAPVVVRRGRTARIACTVTDNLSPTARVTVMVRDSKGHTMLVRRRAGLATGTPLEIAFKCPLPRGLYTFTVKARDLAGNPAMVAAQNTLQVK